MQLWTELNVFVKLLISSYFVCSIIFRRRRRPYEIALKLHLLVLLISLPVTTLITLVQP